jgi:hypothetical protein
MFLIVNMSEDSVYNVLVLNACDDSDRGIGKLTRLIRYSPDEYLQTPPIPTRDPQQASMAIFDKF